MPLVTVQNKVQYNNTRLIMFNKQQYLVKLMMAQRLTHIRAGSRRNARLPLLTPSTQQ